MLFLTIPDRTKHSHIVYTSKKSVLDPLSGQTINSVVGSTSEEMDHSHMITADEKGDPMILPAGVKAHTHQIDTKEIGNTDLTEVDSDEMFEGKSDEQIVSTCRKLFDDSANLEEESRKKGEESENFYKGQQWTNEDKQKLQQEDRTALTINEIQSKVDLLCGFQAQSYTDARIFPVEAGDKNVAEALTMTVKNIFDMNNVNRTESEIFQDEVVIGRGLYNVFVDYNKNPLGTITIEKLNWRDCYFSQHEKPDLSDCDYMTKVKYFPKNKLIKMFPDKAEEIKSMMNASRIIEAEKYSSDYVKKRVGQLDENIINTNLNDIDAQKQTLKLYEMWIKEYTERYTVVNYESSDVTEYSKLSASLIKKLEKMGLSILRRVVTSMRIIKYTGNILLSNEVENIDSFSVIPVYAKHIGGDFFGKVEPAKDVQREINKRTSNAVDVVNKMSSYAYVYDSNTFADQKDEISFRENAMKPGALIKVANVANRPIKENGISMPAELVNMMQLASTKMNVILNIPQEAQGFASREISSVALVETRRSTMQANEYLYSNLASAKRALTKIVIGMIQSVYTPERIARLILPSKPPTTQQEADYIRRMTIAIQDIFTTADLRDYDVAVELSPSSPTIRSANFALGLELLKNGFPIPPETLINMSDLPDKEDILSSINTQKAEAQAQAQAKIDSEIQKTQIAANSKEQIASMKSGANPPPNPQQLGGVPQNQPPVVPSRGQTPTGLM